MGKKIRRTIQKSFDYANDEEFTKLLNLAKIRYMNPNTLYFRKQKYPQGNKSKMSFRGVVEIIKQYSRIKDWKQKPMYFYILVAFIYDLKSDFLDFSEIV